MRGVHQLVTTTWRYAKVVKTSGWYPRHRRRSVGGLRVGVAKAKDIAVQEMQQQAAALGANAVIGVDLDYETIGNGGSMLMVSASGTAVVIE